jgi:hypothetical protein
MQLITRPINILKSGLIGESLTDVPFSIGRGNPSTGWDSHAFIHPENRPTFSVLTWVTAILAC